LKVEGWLDLGELFHEPVIACDPFPIRIDHHETDPARFRGLDEVDDLRMDRRLAAGELDDFRRALGPDEVIQHGFDFLECQAEARSCRRETQGTVHVADAVDLNDAETRVLLVIGA